LRTSTACRSTGTTRYDQAGRWRHYRAHADPGGPDTTSLFDDSPADQAAYDAAFDAWAAAKARIHDAWMYNADRADLTRPPPKDYCSPVL
jgi:hypothetical protein